MQRRKPTIVELILAVMKVFWTGYICGLGSTLALLGLIALMSH
jgi:hypothetical protein